MDLKVFKLARIDFDHPFAVEVSYCLAAVGERQLVLPPGQ